MVKSVSSFEIYKISSFLTCNISAIYRFAIFQKILIFLGFYNIFYHFLIFEVFHVLVANTISYTFKIVDFSSFTHEFSYVLVLLVKNRL